MTDDRPPMEPPTDDAIHEMLEGRANRLRPTAIDMATIVAAAGPRASGRLGRASRLVARLTLAASAVVVVLVASALVAVPLMNRPATSGAPSAFAEASGATVSPSDVGPSSPPTSSIRLLTPAEVGELARTRSRELSTTFAAVRGRLALDVPGCSACAEATFADDDPGVRVRIVGGLRTSWGTSSARTSAWVIRFTTQVDDGLPVVEAMGELRTGRGGGLTTTVDQLLSDDVDPGSYAAVDGWLVRTPLHPCPSILIPSGAPTDVPLFGCPEDDYLTDKEFQPTAPDGSSRGPAKGILLPSESYAKWAPDPAVLGSGVEPRRATYLILLSAVRPPGDSPCRASVRCFPMQIVTLRWQIAARLEPIPDIDSAPVPSASTMDPVALSSGDAWTVADVLAQQSTDVHPQEFKIRAYLIATPPFHCPGASDPTECENDYLTDTPFQPFSSGDTFVSTHGPKIGLKVQIGAYETFAPNPTSAASGAIEPRLGNYLVRRHATPMCFDGAQPSEAPCFGGLGLQWEVIARLP